MSDARLNILAKGQVLYHGVDESPSVEVKWPAPSTDAEMSKLLFDARELVEMFCDVAEKRTGKRADHGRRVVREIDAYRASQGWNPDGFGGEVDDE